MRDDKLTIRVTESEKKKLKWKAKKAGVPVSTLMRAAALGIDITKDARLAEMKELLGSFNKTGNLLDQIAKAVNEEKPVNLAAVAQIFKRVIEAYSKLRKDVERLNDR